MATDERRTDEPEKERLYKTKAIQFLGRTTSIILQNDNGPCPLLAICNILLLRNNLSLSLDTSEVSHERLISLVAEKLLDSNSNTENKDAGFIENQQQNIGDAIDLLPRLATGIDVNVQFRKIDDFEFTRECAIFDLLGMPLYHGWIVDPQDRDTANAIGSKSYNTLMGELVSLETSPCEEMHKCKLEDDCIDFAAATTATLGVPSPSLSRGLSFDDSPHSESGSQRARKGDIEEEAELLRALELSNSEAPTSFDESLPGEKNRNDSSACSDERSVGSDESTHLKGFDTDVLTDTKVQPGGFQQSRQEEQSAILDLNASNSCNDCGQSPETSFLENEHSDSKASSESNLNQSDSREPPKHLISFSRDELAHNEAKSLSTPEEDSSTAFNDHKEGPSEDQQIQEMCSQSSTPSVYFDKEDTQCGQDKTACVGTSATHADPALSDGTREHVDVAKSDNAKSDNSSIGGSEPIYEGEDCILDSGVASQDNREPMYEGEVILAEQAEKGTSEVPVRSEISQHNGDLIKNFLKNNASQLTIFGLFCLQEGLKERELCVFFRNNHFSTMFKYNGELYLLATDQGYINQPDLVWEKLNEVNGDTVFMTGNFTEFKVDNHTSDSWDQQNAMATTADYLASIDNSAPPDSDSDLCLAIALQQQEFENQPQRSQNAQQQSSGGNSRLVTGPQVQRSNTSHSSSKQETKLKEKCTVM